jgi:putative FmdB family regulatory protein
VPVYTYACTACGQEIERRQSFSDAPLTTCESCGGALRRVLHPVGVIFKGSGFYNTDYKKAGNGSSTTGAGDKDKKEKTEGADSKPAETSGTTAAATSKPDSSGKRESTSSSASSTAASKD